MDDVHSGDHVNARASARGHHAATGDPELPFFETVRSGALPRYLKGHVIEPIRTIGAQTTATLKVIYWNSTVEDSPQTSDPGFLSASLRTSPATAWRDSAPSGVISMLPFEGPHWRFERPVSFVQFHLPFELVVMVSESLSGRHLTHDDLQMPADVADQRLRSQMEAIRQIASTIEPTDLLLDSWAMILAEALLERLSGGGVRDGRGTFGRIPDRSMARVIDYIEVNIDQDLRLASLARTAALSVYHFARRFRETVGMTPHAYVLARRIVRARAMLERRRDGLAQVALACGFSSQAHLTMVFHRHLGVTPGAYRRSLQ